MKNRKLCLLTALPAVLLFSCGEKKKPGTGDVKNYPVSRLTEFVRDQLTGLVDSSYQNNDSGMVAMAVYLEKGDSILVDTTYFFSNNDQPLPNDSTVFQMGSVTKTFTAALLARQVNNGRMDLNGFAQNYLPAAGKPAVPVIPYSFNGQRSNITLGQLATMNAGLERNVPPEGDSTPYLYSFTYMNKHPELLYQPGSSCYIYSNLGFGILGLVLCSQAYPNSVTYYNNYEKVVTDSLLAPLAMNDTRITLNPSMQSRLAVPYDSKGKRSGYNNSNWPMNLAAGGLYSTLSDMQLYAREMTGQGSYLTKKDIDTLLQKRSFVWSDTCKSKKDHYGASQAMAWIINNDMKDSNGQAFERYSKDGGLNGFSTFITCSTPVLKGVQYKAYVVIWANKKDFPVGLNAQKVMQEIYSLLQ